MRIDTPLITKELQRRKQHPNQAARPGSAGREAGKPGGTIDEDEGRGESKPGPGAEAASKAWIDVKFFKNAYH